MLTAYKGSLHGGGDDDQGWTAIGQVHMMMDNLLAQDKAKPMIIVMPLGKAVPRSSSWIHGVNRSHLLDAGRRRAHVNCVVYCDLLRVPPDFVA